MENVNLANLEYLRNVLGSRKVDFFREVKQKKLKNISRPNKLFYEEIELYLKTMESYGENKWWLNPNPIIRAYYQLCCPCQLVPFNTLFQKSVEKLLGHSVLDVTSVDFHIYYVSLYSEEAKIAFEKLKNI